MSGFVQFCTVRKVVQSLQSGGLRTGPGCDESIACRAVGVVGPEFDHLALSQLSDKVTADVPAEGALQPFASSWRRVDHSGPHGQIGVGQFLYLPSRSRPAHDLCHTVPSNSERGCTFQSDLYQPAAPCRPCASPSRGHAGYAWLYHSVDPIETNSNYGFNLSWWERLYGVYIAQFDRGHKAVVALCRNVDSHC